MALKKFATVSTPGLHLRVDASRDSSWRDKLSKGDRVEILEGRAGWLFVRVERTGQRGWVYGEHVKLEVPVPDVPPLPLEQGDWSPWPAGIVALVGVVLAVALSTCVGP